MSEETYVKEVVRRIECCQETGNTEQAEIVWQEFAATASPYELAHARALLSNG